MDNVLGESSGPTMTISTFPPELGLLTDLKRLRLTGSGYMSIGGGSLPAAVRATNSSCSVLGLPAFRT